MNARRWPRTPKATALAALLILAAVNAPFTSVGGARAWQALAVAAAAAATADLAATAVRTRRAALPDGPLITALIIAMIVNPDTPLDRVAALAATATLLKHVIRLGRGPVFNPAALALLAAALAPPLGLGHQDWWGVAAAPPYIAVTVVIVTGVVTADKVNRLPLVGYFLAAFYLTLLMFLFFGQGHRITEAYHAPFLNATLFASLIMLTDPPTSPARLAAQRQHAVLTAVIAVAAMTAVHHIYYLPLTLITGNAVLAARKLASQIRQHRSDSEPESIEPGCGRASRLVSACAVMR